MSQAIRFNHSRFGELSTDGAALLQFPGLPGFPAARRFIVRDHDRGTGFAWLISVDDPNLAFVIADPWDYRPDYSPSLDAHALRAVDYEANDELQIVTLVSCQDGRLALNLAAPILINVRAQKGVQVILSDDTYSPRELIAASSESQAGA